MKFRPLKLMKGKKSEVGQTALLKPNFILLTLSYAGFSRCCNHGGGEGVARTLPPLVSQLWVPKNSRTQISLKQIKLHRSEISGTANIFNVILTLFTSVPLSIAIQLYCLHLIATQSTVLFTGVPISTVYICSAQRCCRLFFS